MRGVGSAAGLRAKKRVDIFFHNGQELKPTQTILCNLIVLIRLNTLTPKEATLAVFTGRKQEASSG